MCLAALPNLERRWQVAGIVANMDTHPELVARYADLEGRVRAFAYARALTHMKQEKERARANTFQAGPHAGVGCS
jgi:hypothetical protein